jgi:hypothetical protein
MPDLTAYLLKLSTDCDELKRYQKAKQDGDLVSYLTTNAQGPKLKPSYANALDGADTDTKTISDLVVTELKTESSSQNKNHPFYGLGIHFACEVNHIEHTLTGSGGGPHGKGSGTGKGKG